MYPLPRRNHNLWVTYINTGTALRRPFLFSGANSIEQGRVRMYSSHCLARVAQLDRASASGAEGCGFDPRLAYQAAPPTRSRPGNKSSETISCLTAAGERAKRRLTMTLKRWVLWLCIVALLAGEFFLFSANRQKEAAQVSMREAKQEAGLLRVQLDQLKNSSVATLSAENARLRAENQKLTQKFSQLQNENNQLRSSRQQLTKQLEAASADAQQQQEQSQTENQQAAAPAQPAEQPARPQSAEAAQRNICINNLRQIDAAKQQWALENSKTDDAIPTALELLPFLQDNQFPMCPSGGTYTINAVAVPPACSVPGHALPQ